MEPMLKSVLAVAIVSIVSAASANAAWFARLDTAGTLVVTGIAKDADDISSTVTLICSGDKFSLEILTRNNAEKNDLPVFADAKVALRYKLKGGDVRQMKLKGTPQVSAGGILSIASTLTAVQSQEIYQSISRGYRLDVELQHPELIHDIGVKTVFSENYVQASMGIHEHCKGFG